MHWKRLAVIALGALIIASVVGVGMLFFNQAIHLYTEYLWFKSFDAAVAFWAHYKWPVVVGFVATFLISFWLWFFWVRLLKSENGGTSQQKTAWRFAPTIGTCASVILAGVISAKWIAPQWSLYLLFFYQTRYGVKEPIFGWDISYYLFTLPVFKEVSSMIYSLLFLTSGLVLATWAVYRTLRREETASSRPYLLTLGSQIIAALFVFAAEIYLVKIPGLAYIEHRAPDGNMIFYGAGALEAGLIYWFLWALAVTTIVAIAAMVRTLVHHRDRPFRALATMGFVAGVWLIAMPLFVNEIVPKLFFRVVIGPSEITRQERYIANNIAMTREAFGLSNVETREFIPEKNPVEVARIIARNQAIIKNTRLHDYRMLLPTIQQLQGLRTYFKFFDVDVDRYHLGPNKEYRHVMISVRELDAKQIPGKNWINEHLQYTHGYGAVVIPVNVVAQGGMPHLYVKDFPPQSEYPELRITRPQIYFGEQEYPWALVRTTETEIDYPEGNKNIYTHYDGTGGVPVFTSWFRRAAFAWRMGLWNIILTPYITRETRILYDRSVGTITQKIAPFLVYDKDPYPVISPDGKLYWIRDAMTVSTNFPHAQQFRGVNYIRNAVKVVIDAYHGTTRFYVFDEKDPLIRAWSKIFPGIFKPKSEMPEYLRQHVRFPEDMFLLMAEVYKLYHMEDPRVFYNKEDPWVDAAEIVDVDKKQLVVPYYITERFSPEGPEEMVLMQPFTPKSKENLVGWLSARVTGEHYGKFIDYRFPRHETVYGTMQIEARINQDPKISAQITLWNQHGSQAKHGNLLVIPVENKVLLYVEPLYIAATNASMPEIRRVSVAIGYRIEMAETFEEALQAVLNPKKGP